MKFLLHVYSLAEVYTIFFVAISLTLTSILGYWRASKLFIRQR